MKSHLHLKNCLLLVFTILTLCFLTGTASADQANSSNSSQSTSITGGSSSSTDNGPSAKSAPEQGPGQSQKQSSDATKDSTSASDATETTNSSKTVQPVSSSKAETSISTSGNDQDSGQVAVATITGGNNSTVITEQNNSSSTAKTKVGKSVKLTTPTKAKDVVSESSLDAALLPQTGNTAMDFLFYGGVTSLIFIPAAAVFNIFFK